MSQYSVLLVKELRDAWRSFKFLWIPLVFVLLGVSDPIINYYMEDILNSVGNLPEGFEMIFPEFTPAEILAASTSQFQSIGIILLVAIYASSISRERQNGTATLLYVRPLSYTALFLSKWTVAVFISIVSVAAGYGASMYYTVVLYGKVNPVSFFQMISTYFLWLILAMSITLCMSAMVKASFASMLSIILVAVGLFVDSLVGSFWSISPFKLGNYGLLFLTDGPDQSDFIGTVILSVAIIIVCIVLGILFSRNNAAKIKI